MKKFLDEARQLERELSDLFANVVKTSFDCSQRRVEQVQMAIDSDLFVEFDVDRADLVRELAASILIKRKLVAKDLDELRRTADLCDELITTHDAAMELDDTEGRAAAVKATTTAIQKIRTIYDRSEIVCQMIKRDHDRQLTTFEQMRMMPLEDAARLLGVPMTSSTEEGGRANASDDLPPPPQN